MPENADQSPTLAAGGIRCSPPPAQRPPDSGAAKSRLGPYEILGELGRGGMGCVLEARDPGLDRRIAVKTLLPQTRSDARVRRQFVAEARITGRLEHPGIAPVYYLGADAAGSEFFAMKLVSGRTLHQILSAWHAGDPAVRAEFSEARLLAIFERVVETVGFAHSHGIVHRDLKPGNIMVGRFGEVCVLDWGLAEVLPRGGEASADSEAEGEIAGTPGYMAPEQARGEPVDEGADIFSLGGVLYRILTGHPPIRAGSPSELTAAAARGRVTPVRRTGSGWRSAPETAAIAEKCLAARRADRYADTAALLADLRAYAADEPVSALPDGPWSRLRRTVRRHRRAAAWTGAVAALLLTAATVASSVLAAKDRQTLKAEQEAAESRERALKADLERQRAEASAAERARRRLAAFDPYARATDLLMRGQRPAESAELLRKALAIDPEFPEAQYSLGEALRLAGRPAEAAGAYLEADRLSREILGRPHLPAVLAAGFAFDGAGLYGRSIEAFRRAEREGADEPLALVGRAFRLGEARQFVEARRAAEKAQAAAPHLWETHLARGYALTEAVEFGLLPPDPWIDSAVADLRKALALSPRQAETCIWLANALKRTGRPNLLKEAAEMMDRAVAAEPENGCRRVRRALFRLAGGDRKRADEDAREARRLGAPDYLTAEYEAMAALADRQGETAFRRLGDMLRSEPDMSAVQASWILTGFQLHKDAEVRGAFEKLAAAEPDYPAVRLIRAQVLVRDGNLGAAAAQAEAGLAGAPYNRQLLAVLAQVRSRRSEWPAALAAADRLLEVAPEEYVGGAVRLSALYGLNRRADAAAQLARLRTAFPGRAAEWAAWDERLKH